MKKPKNTAFLIFTHILQEYERRTRPLSPLSDLVTTTVTPTMPLGTDMSMSIIQVILLLV